MTRLVQPLRSGQITIPVEFRRQLGITKNTVLELSLEKGELRIKPYPITQTTSAWMKDLYEMFAPVRKDLKKKKYSEKEIDNAIDKAVSVVRKKHARSL